MHTETGTRVYKDTPSHTMTHSIVRFTTQNENGPSQAHSLQLSHSPTLHADHSFTPTRHHMRISPRTPSHASTHAHSLTLFHSTCQSRTHADTPSHAYSTCPTTQLVHARHHMHQHTLTGSVSYGVANPRLPRSGGRREGQCVASRDRDTVQGRGRAAAAGRLGSRH